MVAEEVYVLSSEGKRENMARVVELMPLLLERDLPTKRTLPILHRVMTRGVHPPWDENLIKTMLFELATSGNPEASTPHDSSSAKNNLLVYLRSVFRKKPNAWRLPKEIRFASSVLGGRASKVRFEPAMLRQGHLRRAGKRSVNDGPPEEIFSHITTPIDDSGWSGTGVNGVYVATNENVGDLFNALCDASDKMHREAKTLDEHLEAVVFMHFMGAAVLHPFFDGNGRAFQAQTVLDLNKLGFPVKEMPGFPEVNESLAGNALDGLAVKFVIAFMLKAGLGIVRPDAVAPLLANNVAYQNYSHQLRNAIVAQIQEGAPKDELLKHFVDNSVATLKYCLSREVLQAEKRGEHFGPSKDSPLYIGPELYRDGIDELIAANKPQ